MERSAPRWTNSSSRPEPPNPYPPGCGNLGPHPASSPWLWLGSSTRGPLAAQHTQMLTTGPVPLATEDRRCPLGGIKGAEIPEGPSGSNAPTPGPSLFARNQRAGTSMTRPLLCSTLNKRFCYQLALPGLGPAQSFSQGMPAQRRGSASNVAPWIPKHTPTSRGRQAGQWWEAQIY